MPTIVPTHLILLMLFIQMAGFVGSLAKGKEANSSIGWVNACLTGLGLAMSVVIALSAKSLPYQAVVQWFSLGGKSFMFGVLLDEAAILMLVVVHFVALLVQVYSLAYMHREREKYRYFAFLNLFIFAMLGIVVANNLLILYVFWELVGLASYLLIGFWHQKPEAIRAAKKAFLVNRIGDAAFLLGIFLYYRHFNTFDLSILPSIDHSYLPTSIGLLLFCGCIAKSAQFPLHVWLPDAMEGPTPVSALIHAATMVAAGIYLLARIFPLLTPDASMVITGVGLITTLLGGIHALSQTDIKKVLAYSTISQLGLMVVAMGTGGREAALFHLLTHAFFKAGLFLGAGSVIFSLHRLHGDFDDQDMRLMGGIRQRMPVTFVCYTIGTAALAGLPLFSGFLSKDTILATTFQWAGNQANPLAFVVPIGALISAGLTALYMTRQWWLVFMGEWRNPVADLENVQEAPMLIKLPIEVLAVLSLGFAFSANPLNASGVWFFQHHLPENHWIGMVSALVAFGGVYAGYRLFANEPFRIIDWTVDLDGFYQRYLVIPTLRFASQIQFFDQALLDRLVNKVADLQILIAKMIDWTDQKVVDGVANGTARLAGKIGQATRRVQSGRVQWYIVAAMVGLLGLVLFVS